MDRRAYKLPLAQAMRKQKIDNMTKRIKTSFIFALARMEEDFGHLWENEDIHGKYYILYQEYRKAVLDTGNNQIRLLEKDLGRIIV